MCFSAEADLVAGSLVGAVGIETLRRHRHQRELPLASVPLVLGSHQLVETLVWWGLAGKVSPTVSELAMWAYLLVAFVVVPVLVPGAVMAVEPDEGRRRRMVPFVALGVVVAATLLGAMIGGPVSAELGALHIAYHVDVPGGGFVAGTYVIATGIPLLLSGYRHVNVLGALNLCAAIALAYTIPTGFASLWCVWAAASSGAIAAHLRYIQQGTVGDAHHLSLRQASS